MFKDILKRDRVPKPKKRKGSRRPQKREQKEIGGIQTDNPALREMVSSAQRDKEREAEQKKGGISNPFPKPMNLRPNMEGIDDTDYTNEMIKRVEALGKEIDFYTEKQYERQSALYEQLLNAFKNKRSPSKIYRTIETTNKFALDKINEKFEKENMTIGKKTYPIIEVLAAMGFDGDPDATVREAFNDAAEYLERTRLKQLYEKGSLNGFKFMLDLATKLGANFPDLYVGRTKGRVDRENRSFFELTSEIMERD